nr:MAG TPA: hypothetical protein [Caudoviricetes sp.]
MNAPRRKNSPAAGFIRAAAGGKARGATAAGEEAAVAAAHGEAAAPAGRSIRRRPLPR